MTEEEISELYTRLAFQYESAIDTLLAKGLIDTDFATEFLRQWENDMNEGFDDRACEELIYQGHTQHRSPLRHLCGFEELMLLECM